MLEIAFINNKLNLSIILTSKKALMERRDYWYEDIKRYIFADYE